MSTITTGAWNSQQSGSGVARTTPRFPMLWMQTKAQARVFWRTPAVSMTGLLMPLMLFVFFVLPHAQEPWQGSISVGAYMLAAIGAYAVSSVMVFNFGVTVAMERGQKVDLLMRAMPLPGWVFLAARVIGALAFGAVAMAVRLSEPPGRPDPCLRLTAGVLAVDLSVSRVEDPSARWPSGQ